MQLLLFSATQWFLYTPVVVILTLRLGSGTGVWATALATLAAGFAVVRPDAPVLMILMHWAALVIFALTTLGLVGLVQALRSALLESDALRAARDRDLAAKATRATACQRRPAPTRRSPSCTAAAPFGWW